MTIARTQMLTALAELLDGMPDPVGSHQTASLEQELAARLGVGHAIAVSSGTAALHTALVAADVGPGDEVLVPALSVVMSVAPIVYTGARPVFVDCTDDGAIDLDDLAAKYGPRCKAVLPVYLWGRCGDPAAVTAFARDRGIRVIEDACQAQGTLFNRQPAGTFGDLGCFSLKDGKILWSGEGGYVVTNDDSLAATCRAYRSHWTTPPPGDQPMSRLGNNHRLPQLAAVIARVNLTHFDELARQRHTQTSRLHAALAHVPGLHEIPARPRETWNGFAPLWRLDLPNPRGFCTHLAGRGVLNSVGSFGLVSCDQRPMFAAYDPAECPTAATVIDTTLAVAITARDGTERIDTLAQIIAEEARQWIRDHA